MKPEQILPLIQIIIQFCSAGPYAKQRKFGHTLYWIAAAVLNIAVTFLM